jgi:ABC-type multidrug transport system fused ATPase/permease subunit
MRRLPTPDPGVPDVRSPGRFIGWLARQQWQPVLGGALFGVLWMLSQAVAPYVVGRALDEGVAGGDLHRLTLWVVVLLALGLIQAGTGLMRHRFAVTNWLTASYTCYQLIARAAGRLGAALPARVAPGEVVAMATGDAPQIGNTLDVTARLSGALVSFVVVALLLFHTSVALALVVLVGVPLLMAAVAPLLRPLHRRQTVQRSERGQLTTLGVDTVAGLRVLRGMGGERAFHDRYVAQSQRVRQAGVEAGRVLSVVDAQQVLLPGIFVVVLTWLGARLAVRGEISVGDLVAFYGWAAFLVLPLRTITEAADKFTRAHVAAGRVLRLLRAEPVLEWGARTGWPGGELVEPESGLVVPARGVTVVACAAGDDGVAIADRVGRYVECATTVGGVRVDTMTEDTVREHLLVVDADTTLFGGPLRDELDPMRAHTDAEVAAALALADATDVVDALPHGLMTVIGERGRSLSGGQRQRVVLARALLADPDVLVLVEPTSAVDAHTEARIATALRHARDGRSTVIVTTSPLLLHVADHAALVVDGVVVASGDRHAVSRHPANRASLERELT